jgi:hypothetical protein
MDTVVVEVEGDAGGIAVAEGQIGRSFGLPDVKRLGIVSAAWSLQRCLADGPDATRHQLPIHMGNFVSDTTVTHSIERPTRQLDIRHP